MSKILPTWEAVFLAADAEIDAFESATLALGGNIRDIKVSMTQKLYEELKNEMKGSSSLFDTLLGLGLNALTGYVAASAARLLVSNAVRGWTVVTTVRTAPIVFKTGGNKYVHGIEASKMLSDLAPLTAAKVLDGVRRKDVINAISDINKPVGKVYTRVEGLLKETMGAVGNVMTDKLSGSSKDDKKTKVSPFDERQKSSENSEIQALIDAMPKTSEESRFLDSLITQVQKSRRIIADMKTIIYNVKSLDEKLDKKLREQWDKSELAIEHLAGDKSGIQLHRIKPEYSKSHRDMAQEFLRSLLLNQWTNSLAFILFGPSLRIGNISKNAYRMPQEAKSTGGWGAKEYALENNLVSNRPIRMYHPHRWSNNKRARSAYKAPNKEGSLEWERDRATIKRRAAVEALIEELNDPKSGYTKSYIDYAATVVKVDIPVPKGGLKRHNNHSKVDAAFDHAALTLFRDMDSEFYAPYNRAIERAKKKIHKLAEPYWRDKNETLQNSLSP